MESKQGLMAWLRSHPWILHALWIGVVLLTMAIVAHFGMLLFTRHGARRIVPELTGIHLSEAQRLAREHDLELIVNDSLHVTYYEGGIVLDQLPEAQVEVKPGRKVYITINAFSQKMVPLPYVAGRSLRQAKNMLEIAGLEIDKLVYREDMATNYVLEESYRGEPVTRGSNRMAEAGSGVTLYVGVEGGYGENYVPHVVGLSLRDAKSRLWENGFNVGEIHFDKEIDLLNEKDARVYLQQPALGSPMALGTAVKLSLTLDEKLLKQRVEEANKEAQRLNEERLKAEEEALEEEEEAAASESSTQEEALIDMMQEDEFFD